MKVFYTIALLCFAVTGSQSQAGDALTKDLRFYGDVMVNASAPEHRERAGGEFYRLFKDLLARSSSQTHAFNDLPWITAIVPADSTFRVLTWQVEGDHSFTYYGFVQFLERGQNHVIELNDRRPLNSEYASFSPEAWYGAIYYGIEGFRMADESAAYMLLGFNAMDETLNQRVADILILENGQLTFGVPILQADTTGSEMKSRIIVEYSDAAAGTMRFDREKHMVVYDHVIPVNTPEGTTLAPDGSYHGHQYLDGKWVLIDKVFNLIMDEPPGGRPSENSKRDLFGRPVEKGN